MLDWFKRFWPQMAVVFGVLIAALVRPLLRPRVLDAKPPTPLEPPPDPTPPGAAAPEAPAVDVTKNGVDPH